jgi:hypothetical protein
VLRLASLHLGLASEATLPVASLFDEGTGHASGGLVSADEVEKVLMGMGACLVRVCQVGLCEYRCGWQLKRID